MMNAAKFPCFFAFLAYFASAVVVGITMQKDTYYVSAKVGEELTLSCQANAIPDSCTFQRPDGKKLCSNIDMGFGLADDYADEDCIDDGRIKISSDCSLTIASIKEDVHMGDWKCEISSFGGSSASATIQVSPFEPAKVEFDKYFASVTIDIGRRPVLPLDCLVFNGKDAKKKFKSPPGAMYFELGSNPLTEGVSDWQKNAKGDWYKSINYTAQFWDNKKAIKCILQQGSNRQESSLTLDVYSFKEVTQRGNQLRTFKDGDEFSELKVVFEAFPRIPDRNIQWKIYDESEGSTVLINPGNIQGNFEANSVNAEGMENTYSAYLRMKSVDLSRDSDKTVELLFTLDNEETRSVAVPFSIKAVTKPTVATSTQKPVDQTTKAKLEETTPKIKAQGSDGASLWIIIAIIAVFVLLCSLFYLKRWHVAKKEEREEEARAADIESSSQPLLIQTSGKEERKNLAQPFSPSKSSEGTSTLTAKEKELIDRLNPSDESITKSDADSQNNGVFDNNQSDNVKQSNVGTAKPEADAHKNQLLVAQVEKSDQQREAGKNLNPAEEEHSQISTLVATLNERPTGSQTVDSNKVQQAVPFTLEQPQKAAVHETPAENDEMAKMAAIMLQVTQDRQTIESKLLAADPSTSSSSSSSSAGGDEDQPVVATQPKEASANKDVVLEPAKPSLQQQQPDETLKLDKEEAEKDVENLNDAAAAAAETKVNNYRSRQSSISSWKSPRSSLGEKELKENEVKAELARTHSLNRGTQTPSLKLSKKAKNSDIFQFNTADSSSSSSSSSSNSPSSVPKKAH